MRKWIKALVWWVRGFWCPVHGVLRASEHHDCTQCALDRISRWSHRVRRNEALYDQVMRGQCPSFDV